MRRHVARALQVAVELPELLGRAELAHLRQRGVEVLRACLCLGLLAVPQAVRGLQPVVAAGDAGDRQLAGLVAAAGGGGGLLQTKGKVMILSQ